MKLPQNKIAIIALVVMITTNLTFAATGKPYSDEWVEGRIQGALAYNTYLDSSDLEVAMSKGLATLSGTVSSDTEKELAQEIALSVDGVTSTKNNIQVNPDLAPRNKPIWLQKFSDATTTAAVKSRLIANKNMRDMNITITTKNGIVNLAGTVSNLEQKRIAEQVTLNTRDVIDVNSDLKIADANTLAEKANNTKVDVSQSVSDSWINSRIRSSLYFSSDFPGSNVVVSTKNGVVTLDGFARNTNQRNEIANYISDFVGVVQVENNLKAKN